MDSTNMEHDATLETFKKKLALAEKIETEMHNRIIELEKLSATDSLTGAWNRAHFDKIFPVEINRSIRYRQPLTLIFFDIDYFKKVNDTYGHEVGDVVLRELTKVASMNMRASDTLFRWGGEEFVILMPSTSYRNAVSLAEALRTKVEQHKFDTVGNITVSLGVAEHISGENEEAYFKRVDAAMYAAKNAGRNRVVVDAHGDSDIWAAVRGTMIIHLDWYDSYSCGEPTIDQQHKKLFDFANELIEAAFARDKDPQKFNSALEKLLAHIVQHFSDEEAILAKYHYANLDTQIAAHKVLIEHALQLQQSAKAGTVTIGELVNFLANEVIAQHMLKVDREFYPLFKGVKS
jgi:diguanylate cyclase (GGDEF)-like protein/hemerythrin-like metal-binding protein